MQRFGTFLIWVLLATGGKPAFAAGAESPADKFLDQSLPTGIPLKTQPEIGSDGKDTGKTYQMLEVPSFWKGVQLLSAITGKKVVLSRELSEWPDEQSEINWPGFGIGLGDQRSIREVFEGLCRTLGVVWRHDAEADGIELAPEWQRLDPRTGKQLVDALSSLRPPLWTELPRGPRNRLGGTDVALDDWRLAFEALLSRPANFPLAGSLRVYHDTHGHFFFRPKPVNNLFTGKITSADGRQQLIVVNGQENFFSFNDPGDMVCYRFDDDGQFVDGGIYGITEGWEGCLIKAEMPSNDTLTLTVGDKHGGNPVLLHFELRNGDLILKGSTDAKGVQRSAEDTPMAYPSFHGRVVKEKYRLSAKPES